jgi:hypothetical protein
LGLTLDLIASSNVALVEKAIQSAMLLMQTRDMNGWAPRERNARVLFAAANATSGTEPRTFNKSQSEKYYPHVCNLRARVIRLESKIQWHFLAVCFQVVLGWQTM